MKNHFSFSASKPFLAGILACAGAAAFACPTAQAGQTSTVSLVHTFGTAMGDTAFFGLIKATDGNYYGTTYEGGQTNAGVLYRLTPAGAYTVVHYFKNDREATPPTMEGNSPGPIIQAKDGNIYGVCKGGGANPSTPDGGGTFFRCSLSGQFAKLRDFDHGTKNQDVFPVALVQGSDGNFYGLSRDGGKLGADEGAYWRLSPDGKTFTELYAFRSGVGIGYAVQGQLLIGKDGNFYGTTSASGGTKPSSARGSLFKATMDGKVTRVASFQPDDNNLQQPPSNIEYALTQGTDGNFYGASANGGNQDFGTIFKVTPTGVVTILHDFTRENDGFAPRCELLLGSDGAFYGGLSAGFAPDPSSLDDGPGGLFKITSTGTLTILRKFVENANGPRQQFGNLVEVTKGVFLGVTAGGSNGLGTIIKETVSPAITSAPTAMATANMPFSYQIKATNGATSYGVLGLAKGLTVDKTTGLISGMITTAGVRNMTLQAINAGGTGTAPLKLTVTN